MIDSVTFIDLALLLNPSDTFFIRTQVREPLLRMHSVIYFHRITHCLSARKKVKYTARNEERKIEY